MSKIPSPYNAVLALASGEIFYGHGVGTQGIVFGEICFNTAITGYQEILTDPSYARQIITFTFPHIGNVGTNSEDNESFGKPTASGLVLRENITNPSSWRTYEHFATWLEEMRITGICGIDTRALTANIRKNGAQNVAIGYGEIEVEAVVEAAKNNPDLNGLELTIAGTTNNIKFINKGLWRKIPPTITHKIAAIDYGIKDNILRNLHNAGLEVQLFPANTAASEILATSPDGIFLSNGAGDPAATAHFAVPIIQELLVSGKPIFGICMGHQLLATALGCRTEKMKQGHRGANHPVQDLRSKKVEITSQNHGFVVAEEVPAHVTVTHRSLFDGTIAGICSNNAFSVQYHPEASPGPHDSHYLFRQFIEMLAA